MFGPLLEVEMSKKCTPLWRAARFEVKSVKNWEARSTSWRSARDCAPCQKWAKREGFVAVSKTMAGVGHMERIWQDACRVAGAVHEIRAVRRCGRWFLHQIFSFGKMIWRDRCSTSYDLASLFPGRRSTLDRWSGKIAKRIGTRPSALHSAFHFWKKSRRIASFLMLSTSKNQEVSQNFRFWRCQVQALRKSRRISAFLMLSSSKTEEVSQNSCVFKLAARQADRQTNR